MAPAQKNLDHEDLNFTRWFCLLQDQTTTPFEKSFWLRGFKITFASPSTTSSSVELSFQSSFLLSLAVLVRYRSFVWIFSLGWNLPPFLGLHSQTTRLVEFMCNSVPPNAAPKKEKTISRDCHPLWCPFSRELVIFMSCGVGCTFQRLQLRRFWLIDFLLIFFHFCFSFVFFFFLFLCVFGSHTKKKKW